MIPWFVRNQVAANLLLVGIVMAGITSLMSNIPLEVFPSFTTDTIDVRVTLRGSTPEEAEQSLAIRIEEELQSLEGIKQIVSRSVEGGTTVSLQVEDHYDPRELLADVKSRVDAINTFPSEAERPVISLQERRSEVIVVTLFGPLTEKEIRQYAEIVRNDLLNLDQVTQVEVSGVRNYEIAVEVDSDTLRDFGLTLSDVSAAISRSSLDLSGGNIRTQGADILIRSKGQAYHRDEFDQIVVKTNPDGSVLTVGDLARVEDGFEETSLLTRFNGQPSALIEVYRVGNQNAIDIAEQVRGYIEEQQSKLPKQVQLNYWDDDSVIIEKRINTLVTNAIQGGILVILLLALFLRPAVALWVFIGIPVSFLGAFIFMPILGVTINIMSVFGFILVLGIVVDDAIVTGENVYSHLRRSENGVQAAINGTLEVATPVTFGVLTTVVAFLPLGFMEGTRGQFFAQIPAVVIPVLMFSLIESKFVLPAHLSHLKFKPDAMLTGFALWQQNFANGFERMVEKYYTPLLYICVRFRYSLLAIFIGLFFIVKTTVTTGFTEFIFFPKIPSETVRANLNMPVGTPFEVTDRHVQRWVDEALKLQEKYRDAESGESVILNILSITGSGGGNAHQGRVRFEIAAPEDRKFPVTSNDLLREWRQGIGVTPGAESTSFRAEVGRGGDPIDVEFRGSNVSEMERAAAQLKKHLATYPEVFDITDSLSDGKQELQLELTPEGHALGLNRSDLIRQVRQAFFGIDVQRFQRGRDDVRVMVRFPIEERRTIADLEEMIITTNSGKQVPLNHVAVLFPSKAYATVYRIDNSRTVSVRADVDKESANMTVLQSNIGSYLEELMQSYPSLSYRLEGEAREQQESFGSLFLGLILVLFAIYVLLAIPFKSYGQPIIVMSIIPFGLIGAVFGHWIMGDPLTIMSVLGMLALVGIMVNDSLVLVDFINKHKDAPKQDRQLLEQVQSDFLIESGGGEVIESQADTISSIPATATIEQQQEKDRLRSAILTAGVARFRPVFLTSATTFMGLMPLLFEKSTQAQFLIPMAISLGFGILFATFVTLLMVPANYMIYEDAKALGRKVKGFLFG